MNFTLESLRRARSESMATGGGPTKKEKKNGDDEATGNTGAAAASSGSGGGKGAGGGGERLSSGEYIKSGRREILDQLSIVDTKLTLASSLANRENRALICTTITVPSNHGVIDFMKAATRKYNELTHGKKGKHDCGQPAHFAWRALCLFVAEDLPEVSGAEKKTKLQQHVEVTKELKKIRFLVAHCQLKGAWNGGYKVEFMVAPSLDEIKTILVEYFDDVEDADVKAGKAPRSGLERDAQKLLDKLAKVKL
eukprot:TRINITY_DN8945_c0_g1_i6.p1 TRINITY_DN8945_c0_g1~~TRINITY_DN8945_c0_g1_i6.p1  ORF type:complete len:252 (-),score=76.94 TRINITY_DN8945_c0_g1_i6:584-1339(-)